MKTKQQIIDKIQLAKMNIQQGHYVIENKRTIEALQWVLDDPQVADANERFFGNVFGHPVFEYRGMI